MQTKNKGCFMKKLLFALAPFALAMNAFAAPITVTVDSGACTGTGLSAAQCTQLQTELQSEVEDTSTSVSIDKYATGTANALAVASKGKNSDYADIFSVAVVNAGAGVGLSGDASNPEGADGVALSTGVTVGVHMGLLPIKKIGFIEMDKLDLFGSFLGIDQKQDSDDSELDTEVSNFGFMARYQLLEGADFVPGYMVEWGGVHVHVGFYKSTMKLTYTQQMDDVSSTVGGQTATFTNSTGTFTIDTEVTSIPIEISTYVRLAYLFTLYGGFGVDINSGSSDVGVSASGDIFIGATDIGGIANNPAETEGDGSPEGLDYRAFAGIQFNIPFLRLYLQGQKGLGSDTFAMNFGAKILY